uniref:Uncharacterized protein n=1 Tax=Cuerna arida TaxID=1464854 RepID=A0A1B6GSH8_9HEMI
MGDGRHNPSDDIAAVIADTRNQICSIINRVRDSLAQQLDIDVPGTEPTVFDIVEQQARSWQPTAQNIREEMRPQRPVRCPVAPVARLIDFDDCPEEIPSHPVFEFDQIPQEEVLAFQQAFAPEESSYDDELLQDVRRPKRPPDFCMDPTCCRNVDEGCRYHLPESAVIKTTIRPPPVFYGPHLPPGGLPPPSPEPEPEIVCPPSQAAPPPQAATPPQAAPPPQTAPPPQAPLRLSDYYYPDMPNFEAKYPKYDPKKHRTKEFYERMKEINLDIQKRYWVLSKGLYLKRYYPDEAPIPPEQKAGPSGVTCRKPTTTAGQRQGGVRPKSKLNAPGTSGVTGRKPATGTRRGQQGAPVGRGTGVRRPTAGTNCPPPGGRGQQRPMTGHDVDMDLVRGNIATPGAAPPPRACPPKQSRLSQLAQPKRRC